MVRPIPVVVLTEEPTAPPTATAEPTAVSTSEPSAAATAVPPATPTAEATVEPTAGTSEALDVQTFTQATDNLSDLLATVGVGVAILILLVAIVAVMAVRR